MRVSHALVIDGVLCSYALIAFVAPAFAHTDDEHDDGAWWAPHDTAELGATLTAHVVVALVGFCVLHARVSRGNLRRAASVAALVDVLVAARSSSYATVVSLALGASSVHVARATNARDNNEHRHHAHVR